MLEYSLIKGDYIMSEDRPEERLINNVILQSQSIAPQDTIHPQLQPVQVIPKQADTDQDLIGLWLHGKSRHTQRYYKSDVEHFFQFTQKNLKETILKDLQNFSDHIDQHNLTDGSKRRILSSIKSLISYAHRLGYLFFDVSRPLILPTPKDTLAERILSQDEVHRIIYAENHPRNRLILETLFISGIRVSELCSLCWKDMMERSDGGQMTVFGKGSKTRVVLIPEPLWSKLMNFKGSVSDDIVIFRGRQRNTPMHPTTVLRIVRKATRKAKINKNVSTHWLRHAHASLSAEKAPLHIIQQSLGHASIQTTSRYLHVKPNDCSSKYLEI
jgi:integrase/recombinase XerD